MAKKYGVASDYIKYTSRIKSDTSDGVAVEASQVVDLEEDKLQSDINKELKASIASASGKTYSKSEIDSKDTATLTSAKSYADTKKTEAVSAAATDATTKANSALASAKSYADQKVSALGSVYTTKGSCTAAQLKALTSAKAGDVWNITDAITIDGKAYPAGVNVVCVTAFSAAIDPAATKNWDALQGLQDLTSYAKKSEIEDTAVANVKFAQEEFAQDNGVSFKKTITFVNGREATTESDLGILPATSTTAGVMSAADKVKLDAVDGKIGDVKIVKESDVVGGGYQFSDLNGINYAILRPKAYIYGNVSIGTGAQIGEKILIENSESFDAIGLTRAGFTSGIRFYEGVDIHKNVTIGEGVDISDTTIIGTNLGTSLVAIHDVAHKVAIGSGVKIANNVELSVDEDGILNWGKEIEGSYQVITAATANDISALARRVSALEDLLKLA
jgi:acetyltransferase-like isoleucine patch superfamily enzyme|nr:MAG TPA: Pilin glycosylation protein-handed beta-helix, rossmann fold, acetyltransferase.67A [Caudoviricetes sp.]